MFAFTPHGTTFAVPVTVTLPFDPASVPAGAHAALYKTNAVNQWVQVTGARFGSDSVTAQVTGFSWVHGRTRRAAQRPDARVGLRAIPGDGDTRADASDGATAGRRGTERGRRASARLAISTCRVTQTVPAERQGPRLRLRIARRRDLRRAMPKHRSPSWAAPSRSAASRACEQTQSFIKRRRDATPELHADQRVICGGRLQPRPGRRGTDLTLTSGQGRAVLRRRWRYTGADRAASSSMRQAAPTLTRLARALGAGRAELCDRLEDPWLWSEADFDFTAPDGRSSSEPVHVRCRGPPRCWT